MRLCSPNSCIKLPGNAMNIWHVEAKPSPYKTNGLSNTVWLLA
jgi:hypothetical protein